MVAVTTPDFHAADRLYDAGRWREAIVAYEAVVEDFPGNGRAHARIATAFIRLGEHDAAIDRLGRLPADGPFRYLADHRLAIALAGAGRPEEALEALRASATGGLRDLAAVEEEPLLASVRALPG